MTLYGLLNEGSAALLQAGDADGENDAKLFLFEAFHLDLVHFLMDRLRPLSEQDEQVQEQIRTYRGMIAKRASRIPLQQILGSAASGWKKDIGNRCGNRCRFSGTSVKNRISESEDYTAGFSE